jgi:hypothetical protein
MIPLPEATWTDLLGLAGRFGVKAPQGPVAE